MFTSGKVQKCFPLFQFWQSTGLYEFCLTFFHEQCRCLLGAHELVKFYIPSFYPVVAASGSLSAKMKKVQGSRGKSRTGTGTIKVAEPVGEVWEHGSCDSIRRDKTNA